VKVKLGVVALPLLAASILAVNAPAIGQQSSMPAGQRPMIQNGPVVGTGENMRNLYLLRCSGCHGRDGEGTAWDWPKLGPALKGNPFVQNAPAAAIISVLRKGRSGRQRLYHESYPNMPPFGAEALFDADGMVAFLKGELQK